MMGSSGHFVVAKSCDSGLADSPAGYGVGRSVCITAPSHSNNNNNNKSTYSNNSARFRFTCLTGALTDWSASLANPCPAHQPLKCIGHMLSSAAPPSTHHRPHVCAPPSTRHPPHVCAPPSIRHFLHATLHTTPSTRVRSVLRSDSGAPAATATTTNELTTSDGALGVYAPPPNLFSHLVCVGRRV
eukprot:365808-Chlamydomonas_euryale.AAC.7